MRVLLPKLLNQAGRWFSVVAEPLPLPVPVPVASAERAGWPAASLAPVARRRSAEAVGWSPEGPSGDWKRRSLDRFAHFRR